MTTFTTSRDFANHIIESSGDVVGYSLQTSGTPSTILVQDMLSS